MKPTIKVFYFPHGVLTLNSEFFPCTKKTFKGIYNIAVMSTDEDEVTQNIDNLIYLLEERADTFDYHKDQKGIKKVGDLFNYLQELRIKDGRL